MIHIEKIRSMNKPEVGLKLYYRKWNEEKKSRVMHSPAIHFLQTKS
jgi:hypothetical protein